MVNKLVVVTGAGRGIGRATAAAFAAAGATVVCADVDGEAAEKTAGLCAERGGAGRAEYGVGVPAVCPGFVNTPMVGSTRYLGSRGDARTRARIEKIFRRGHPPETVARAIVSAAERNPAVVPVGWEARLGWHLRRLTPLAVQDRLARLDLL